MEAHSQGIMYIPGERFPNKPVTGITVQATGGSPTKYSMEVNQGQIKVSMEVRQGFKTSY